MNCRLAPSLFPETVYDSQKYQAAEDKMASTEENMNRWGESEKTYKPPNPISVLPYSSAGCLKTVYKVNQPLLESVNVNQQYITIHKFYTI